MEPEHRLGQDLQNIDGRIESQDMAELVTQNLLAVLCAVGLDEIRRKINASTQQTPHKRLTDPLDQPDLWGLPDAQTGE